MTTCTSGFTGVSGICQACASASNCETCSGSVSHCLTCLNGTYFLSSTNECLTTCIPTMFNDAINGICVGCTSPCDTCSGSATTCVTCVSGFYILNSTCLSACPAAMFIQGSTCIDCSTNCSVCTSATTCTTCSGLSVLYLGACITTCPSTSAVLLNGVCTACSTQNCYSCSAADVCEVCSSGTVYLNTACLAACPSNYTSNGTHCLENANATIIDSITSPSTFPIPFTIAGSVLVIACLMSKLQFSQTYLSGAIYSFIGILEVLALFYFIYLYYIDYFDTEPVPIWIALGSLAWLYFLNLVGTVAQCVFLCHEKEFVTWRDSSGFHRCFYGFINVLSLCFNHKTRNILFCKLFTFKIFSAKLDNVNHFRIFNIFSLLSLGHSGGAIFAAAIALKYIDTQYQIYY